MALLLDKNPFMGINPYLNSFLQDAGGGWESFHSGHINDLCGLLDAQLPSRYYAIAENSLQIKATETFAQLEHFKAVQESNP